VFGSFVSAKPEPNDVDIFLLMDDSFDVKSLFGEMRLHRHTSARAYSGFVACLRFKEKRRSLTNGE